MYAQQYLQEVAYILGCVELGRACSWRLVDLYREGQTAKQRREDKKHISVIINFSGVQCSLALLQSSL